MLIWSFRFKNFHIGENLVPMPFKKLFNIARHYSPAFFIFLSNDFVANSKLKNIPIPPFTQTVGTAENKNLLGKIDIITIIYFMD